VRKKHFIPEQSQNNLENLAARCLLPILKIKYISAMKKLFLLLLVACTAQAQNTFKTIGKIEKYHADLDKIIKGNPLAEIISEGHVWTEGPLWIKNMLLFSDAPNNTVYKWTEKKGTEVYLKPSGFTGKESKSKEPGSNGLLLDNKGNLVLCQHGDRQMAKMDASLEKPKAKFISLANNYQGKRFSSPNDAAINSKGEIFFTDPPYGLPSQGDQDPTKEIPYNGVYKIKTNGEVILLVDSLTRPNGIALFPDEKKLLIANSDSKKPYWYIYDIDGDKLTNGKIFYRDKLPGGPDGLKIGKDGIIYTSGPGGILFLNAEGVLLGRLKVDEPVSNCSLSEDEKTLYITNNKRVLRFRMRD
jgi:gluconolactonase